MELPKYLPLEEYIKLPRKERIKRYIKLRKTEEERATELHEKLIIIDIHEHITGIGKDTWPTFNRDMVRESGVTCFCENIVGRLDYLQSIRRLGASFSVIDQNKDITCRAFRADDIRRAKKEEKVAFMCELEVQALGGILDRMDIFYGLGVRGMGLTYNAKNFVGDGCRERTDCGLSYYGLAVIDRMNKLGMIINLSHAGYKTALEAIEASRDPCSFTHVVTDLSLNKTKGRTDEEFKACAEKGGLVGIEAVTTTLQSVQLTAGEINRVGIWDVLDHIDYVVNMVGVDYVAIGTDIGEGYEDALAPTAYSVIGLKEEYTAKAPPDGRAWFGPRPPWTIPKHARMVCKERIPGYPFAHYTEGLYDIGDFLNVIRGLVSRGYSDKEIENIVGGNALRLIERVVS